MNSSTQALRKIIEQDALRKTDKGKWQQWTRTGKDWNRRRRYARSINRARMGVYGRLEKKMVEIKGTQTECLLGYYGFTLTSSPQVNDFNTLLKDFHKLLRQFRKDGHTLDYYAVPEKTPRNGLYHLHGIFRTSSELSWKDLSRRWYQAHHSDQVALSYIWNLKGLTTYCIKHLVKQYGDDNIKQRPLVSKQYYPIGWKHVESILSKAVAQTIIDWNQANTIREQWLTGQNSPDLEYLGLTALEGVK